MLHVGVQPLNDHFFNFSLLSLALNYHVRRVYLLILIIFPYPNVNPIIVRTWTKLYRITLLMKIFGRQFLKFPPVNARKPVVVFNQIINESLIYKLSNFNTSRPALKKSLQGFNISPFGVS